MTETKWSNNNIYCIPGGMSRRKCLHLAPLAGNPELRVEGEPHNMAYRCIMIEARS